MYGGHYIGHGGFGSYGHSDFGHHDEGFGPPVIDLGVRFCPTDTIAFLPPTRTHTVMSLTKMLLVKIKSKTFHL